MKKETLDRVAQDFACALTLVLFLIGPAFLPLQWDYPSTPYTPTNINFDTSPQLVTEYDENSTTGYQEPSYGFWFNIFFYAICTCGFLILLGFIFVSCASIGPMCAITFAFIFGLMYTVFDFNDISSAITLALVFWIPAVLMVFIDKKFNNSRVCSFLQEFSLEDLKKVDYGITGTAE